MKKLFAGVAATLLLTGGLIYAVGSHTTNSANVCPDRPGCVCSKPKTEAVAQKPTTVAVDAHKDVCPNRPGCVCK